MRLQAVLLLCLFAYVFADEQELEEEQPENTGLSAIQFPGEFSLSDGVLRTVSIAGALVTGVAGLAAILSFVLPAMGLRTCMIFGGCDEDPVAYNPALSSNSVYDQQGYNYHQYPGGFRKRSLEYVGPILKALSSAYEKYGPPAQKHRAAIKAPATETK